MKGTYWFSFGLYLDFEPRDIEKLEEELRLRQAKLKVACGYLDRQHQLTMDEKRKLQ